MADSRRKADRKRLKKAGFRRQRWFSPRRLLRRLVWPVVQPFHMYTLERVRVLADGIARLEAHLRAVQAALDQTAAQKGELANHAADLAAFGQRLSALDGAAARRSDLSGLAAQIAGLSSALDGLGQRVALAEDLQQLTVQHAEQRADLMALVNRQVWVDDAVEELQKAARRPPPEELPLPRSANPGGLFVAATQGGIFVLKQGELISDMAARDRVWDAHVLAAADRAAEAARARLGSAGSAVDAGAHFGLISVALGQRFDRVVSLEPNRFNVALLRANVALNGLWGRVEVHAAGLFSHPTTLSLARSEEQEIALPLDEHGELDPERATNLGAYSFTERGSGVNDAEAFTLDSLGLHDVSFLKIDVQGADGEVIMGARETLKRCQPWIVFEWEDELSKTYAVSFGELEAVLEGLGYSVTVLKRHNAKQVDYLAMPAGADTLHVTGTRSAQTHSGTDALVST